ncbi:hypothetical protein [Piscinibacter sp.]|uniref:hypothetical protein n=1 Tax=Piscinibacter sp. TaxID=1903157 RepID=UPI003559905B
MKTKAAAKTPARAAKAQPRPANTARRATPRATAPAAVPPHDAAQAQQVQQVLRGKRFLAADRAGLDLAEIATWDPYLLRDHRLLAPIDVQALYVPPGSKEAFVRLPMLLAGAGGEAAAVFEDGMPEPFAPGKPRPAGVHMHWAMPDALLRGRLATVASGSANRLGLPALPDRWVVLRLVLPRGAHDAIVTGWVIEADRSVAVPLGSWTEGSSASQTATPAGVELGREELTGTAGGSVSWAAVYDAVLNRFAFHDPLADLATLAPHGVDDDCASYVVAGWWSDPALDPLDAARGDDSLHELLERLRWRLLHEWGDESWALEQEKAPFELRKALGLTTAERWSSPRPVSIAATKGAPRAAASSAVPAYVPFDKGLVQAQEMSIGSVFAADASQRLKAKPWQLRSSLLHGAIYGVPVTGAPPVDRRPAANALAVAIGQHDDDLVAAFAAAQATTDQQRATERLITAFTAQKVNRLGSADGLVELEEHEHAVAFASLPAGNAGTDRYLQRVQTGGVGGLGLGRDTIKGAAAQTAQAAKVMKDGAPGAAHAHPLAARASKAGASPGTQVLFATGGKPALAKASTALINDIARSRVGEVLAPTEARVVNRPAPRWTFPTEPLVAVRGAARSLRHGGDGRGSADGKLTCRWPTHVIQEVTGIIAPDRFIRSLGNGAVPNEVLTLAREALLHDPYHDEWIAAAVAPPGTDGKAVLQRLKAESVLRFGADGTYDGATTALHPTLAKTAAARRRAAPAASAAGVREQQVQVADELRKFSLYKGADPDLVGVTTWSQPWVPMWLEWQVSVEGLDPDAIVAWQLGAIDLERAGASFDGGMLTLSGRSQLTAGGAATLHDAISDWLKAEEALDAATAGLVDEATEDAYRALDTAVRHLDLVTASLDGLRPRLLGLPANDGLRRPSDGAGGVTNPAPTAAPYALLAGCVTLQRARLLDVFGRTLEVPLNSVHTPTRNTLATRPGVLALRPRLLRPARWLFRLVDSATAVGAEGTEARVDQIEAALQVNPVAGFVMPDHLDESLEVFGVDGSPIGELLHEPVSGGVMWEIAAGREGPADAGPQYGLTPAQAALGSFAAGLVAADSAARQGAPLADAPPDESALSALLRAIDTTLWSVDSFASLGSEHVAGLVGRPVAVVRAQLRLEVMPPTDVDLSDPARAAEWDAALEEARQYAFPVRIGEITRSDDGVLGFFADDDYSRFRLVDKAIAASAADAGRSRGQLGLLGRNEGMPPKSAIEHPYIAGTDDADTLALHIGQTVTLTIFMHPAGKCSLTSGVLPRKQLALARDWVGPGLAAIAPSLRTGPVLVETDLDTEGQVRLPKVSVFGKNQNFLWRDTPATWRTDAILAATQTALLPDTPAELREGWIRVAPDAPEGAGGGAGGAAS